MQKKNDVFGRGMNARQWGGRQFYCTLFVLFELFTVYMHITYLTLFLKNAIVWLKTNH